MRTSLNITEDDTMLAIERREKKMDGVLKPFAFQGMSGKSYQVSDNTVRIYDTVNAGRDILVAKEEFELFVKEVNELLKYITEGEEAE